MADSWHVSWLREGVASWNRRRKKVSFLPNLAGVDFFELLPERYRSRAKTSRFFEGINLKGADLTGAKLSKVNLNKANFSKSNLRNADLRASSFVRAVFNDSDMKYVTADRADFRSASFFNVSLEGASFLESEMGGVRLELEDKVEFSKISVSIAEGAELPVAYSSSPISSTNKVLRLEKDKPIKEKGIFYDVMFGTTREPIYSQGELEGFDVSGDKKIHYGVCEVFMPDKRTLGSLGSPLWRRVISRHDDRIKIGNITGLNEDLFWTLLSQKADRSKVVTTPTLFVHGFNSTFENAVLRSAQIGHDLGIGQGIALFSWPANRPLK